MFPFIFNLLKKKSYHILFIRFSYRWSVLTPNIPLYCVRSPMCSCYLFHFPSPCFSKLGLHLPYPVHSDKGKAQFFSEKEELEVTLMVKRPLDFINTCWQRIATSIQEGTSCSVNSVKTSCDINWEVQRKGLISLRSKLLILNPSLWTENRLNHMLDFK